MTIHGRNARCTMASSSLAGPIGLRGREVAPPTGFESPIATAYFPAPGSALADLSPAFQAETRGIYNWSSATSSPGRADDLTEHRQLFDPPDDDDYVEGYRFKYLA